MAGVVDRELGLSAQALMIHEKRLNLLARNLANADTPGFKARDIDFRATLSRTHALVNSSLAAGSTLPAGTALEDPQVLYRVPLAPTLDGNTVDTQLEEAAVAETSVRYQSSLALVNDAFRGLMMAITGK